MQAPLRVVGVEQLCCVPAAFRFSVQTIFRNSFVLRIFGLDSGALDVRNSISKPDLRISNEIFRTPAPIQIFGKYEFLASSRFRTEVNALPFENVWDRH